MRSLAVVAVATVAAFSLPSAQAAPLCRVKGRHLEIIVETASNNELRAVHNNRVIETLVLQSGVKGRIKTSVITDEIIVDAAQKLVYRSSRSISFGFREVTLEIQGNGNYGYTVFRKSIHDHYTADSSANYVAFAPQCTAVEALFGGYALFHLSQK